MRKTCKVEIQLTINSKTWREQFTNTSFSEDGYHYEQMLKDMFANLIEEDRCEIKEQFFNSDDEDLNRSGAV